MSNLRIFFPFLYANNIFFYQGDAKFEIQNYVTGRKADEQCYSE